MKKCFLGISFLMMVTILAGCISIPIGDSILEISTDGIDFVSDDDFFFETVTVEVTDGQIVLDNGDADKNDVKINYIEIASIALADAGDAGDDGAVEDTNDDGAVAQPDMPKTGLGGAGNGNGAVLIALLFVSAMVVVVIRKRNGNQA